MNTKILTSILMICVVAGMVGAGTLADFVDSEISEDNSFSSGHMDLKVSVGTGIEYDDPDVPAIIQRAGAWPRCSKDAPFDLHNFGAGQGLGGYAYMHIKNVECFAAKDKNGNTDKCEAEYVAESGGVIGQKCIPGIGDNYGEDCNFSKHVQVVVMFDTNGDGTMETIVGDLTGNNPVYLSELNCTWLDLGFIENCETHDGKIFLSFVDLTEEQCVEMDLLTQTYFDPNDPVEQMFVDWPTAALMTDGVSFDVEFVLHQSAQPQLPFYTPNNG